MTPDESLGNLLDARRSCRAYRPDPVPRSVIEAILRDAGRAPSWCNVQPWQVHVVSGRRTGDFAAAMLAACDSTAPQADYFYPMRYSGPRRARAQDCAQRLHQALGIARRDTEARRRQLRENYRFFGAPHVAVIACHRELGPYGTLDCGGFITTFCLAAQARGVASVPLASIAYYAATVRQFLHLEEDQLVLAAIAFGYGDADHPVNGFRTGRAGLDELVTWHEE
ncbi:nitroreductase [Shimia sp.]|uniref:nitroreductase n=1 Tax=Shimia sp. TaxID=1954381 RepID=UPI00356AFE6E